MPIALKAFISLLLLSLEKARRHPSKVAIGKAKVRYPGSLKKRISITEDKGRPLTTIFLIKSNSSPKDNIRTKHEDNANARGGNISVINHLSRRGMILIT
jgi:hypothetical protein